MLDDIRQFYEKTKLGEVIEDDGTPWPITWKRVFHKEYPRLPSVPLPASKINADFDSLLAQRKATRIFSDNPLTLDEIGTILRTYRIVDSNRDPERRTYPSAGARFPIELYLIAFNVAQIDAGAYHYNIKREILELLWKQQLRPREKEIVSPYLENPAAAIVLTSVIARSEVKYGVKSYPYSLIEAGHVGQNIQLGATSLGIGSCPVGGFVNDAIQKILDLTDDEIPVYVIGLGKTK